MADVSLSMDLQAKALYEDLQRVQGRLAGFATNVQAHGEKAGKGFSTGVTSGVGGAFSGLKGAIGGVLGGLGVGLGVGAIVGKFEQVIERGSRIHDIAAKFGLDAEQLQLIGNAAEQDGVSLDRVAAALNLLQINGAKAAAAGSPLNEVLQRMKIDVEGFVAANPAEKFFQVGEAWRTGAQGAQEYADVASLVGKRNTDVIVTMSQTREQIEKVSKSFGILSQESVNALDRAGDSIKEWNNRVTVNIGSSIGWLDKFNAKAEVAAASFAKFMVQHGLAPKAFAEAAGFKLPGAELTPGGGEFGGTGAGSSWADEAAAAVEKSVPSGPAINPFDVYARALKAGVTPETSLAATDYATGQGFDAANANINLKQAAEFQRQNEAFNAYWAQPEVQAAQMEPPVGTTAESLEQVRLAELESGMQGALAEQEMQIGSAPSIEAILEQIRDNTADATANK